VYKNKPYQFTEYRQERYRELIENQNEYWWSMINIEKSSFYANYLC
jgi:chaperone required for assembly of F1-ATPase